MEQKLRINDIPPNLNETIGMTKRHWGQYYNKKKKWSKLIQEKCKEQNLQPHQGSVKITLQNTYPNRRRRDPDNIILKFILDGLVEAGIIQDDSFEYIEDITIKRPVIQKDCKDTVLTITDSI